MKKIYIVIQQEENGKYYAFADAIRTGENLKPFIERYNSKIFHHEGEHYGKRRSSSRALWGDGLW